METGCNPFAASHKTRDAVAFLKAELAAGPRPAKEVEALALAAGIAHSTLVDARKRLGVVSQRVGRQWIWQPPKSRKRQPIVP